MATTSLELVKEREWGFCGRVILMTSLSGLLRSWKWSVQSHDADTNNAGMEGQYCPQWSRFWTYNALCCIQ